MKLKESDIILLRGLELFQGHPNWYQLHRVAAGGFYDPDDGIRLPVLVKEGYIEEIPVEGRNLPVLKLTKKGHESLEGAMEMTEAVRRLEGKIIARRMAMAKQEKQEPS